MREVQTAEMTFNVVVSFERPHVISYQSPVVPMSLSCTISETVSFIFCQNFDRSLTADSLKHIRETLRGIYHT